MECPMCGATTRFEHTYCPRCGYQLALSPERPLPNWRRLPGLRAPTTWKAAAAAVFYLALFLMLILPLLVWW